MQDPQINPQLKPLKTLSTLMDSQFRGPFGWRFGLDGILGLIPVVGDLATTAVSIFILAQASRLGCSASTISRMAINIAIENIVDMIPGVGNIFDFFWKANNKNIQILESHVQNPAKVTLQSRFVVALVIISLIALLIGSGYVTFMVFEWIINLFKTGNDQWSV